jgi:hypothetical protein
LFVHLQIIMIIIVTKQYIDDEDQPNLQFVN